MKKSYHHYNKNLKEFARTHRNDSTQTEIRLWSELLRDRKMGYSFLRQRPILNYIAAFFCKELKLIIEVDGLTHQDEEIFKKDLLGQKDLEERGYQVIRFSDHEVMNDLENVRRTLGEWVEKNHPPNPLAPPLKLRRHAVTCAQNLRKGGSAPIKRAAKRATGRSLIKDATPTIKDAPNS